MPYEQDSIIGIINEARKRSAEMPWVEFKENYADPQAIGEYVSALSNTAALFRRNTGLLIWGINDATHKVVGTSFDPQKKVMGNQSLELWISTLLEPRVQIYFHEAEIEGLPIVMLEVAAAYSEPVRFQGIEYIRIGTNKKKLKDFPDTERQLWAVFSKVSFEELVATENLTSEAVLDLLDYQSYYRMMSFEAPDNSDSILDRLQSERMVARSDAGLYNITNMGALLYARRLSNFPALDNKLIRVIRYYGNDRVSSTSKEHFNDIGYANGYERLIEFIMGIVPISEFYESGIRKSSPMLPELIVREVVGNLMIHQDLYIRGTYPMVEIFDSRMEVTNLGPPLIDKYRFLDFPPVARNDKMARFLRRVSICEEKGSGYDKIVQQTEEYNLPPPAIMVYETHTKVTIYEHKSFAKMSKEDRQLACYLHACLKYVKEEDMTNTSLRERFAVDVKNSSMISRLLNDTCAAGLIKLKSDTPSDKHRRFLPYWA